MLAAPLSGCGGSGTPATPAVRLTVGAPSDSTRVLDSTVQVRGSVSPPSATVLVAGQPASVYAGSFSAQVALRPGTNLVDVMASGPRGGVDMTALRVVREVMVRLPDVTGATATDASGQLSALGLRADVSESGGLLEPFLPGDPVVCSTNPPAGRLVAPSTTVHVDVSKGC